MKKVNERELRRAFGDSLATARHEAGGMKLPRLAELSGVEALTINAYEAGTIMPSLDDVYALAVALDMHPAELLPVLDGEAPAPADDLYPEDDEEEDE